MTTCKKSNHFGTGLVFIGAGAIFLMGNMGLIPYPFYDVLTSWPMILVAIGLITLFKGEITPTLILFSIAAYFLLPRIIPGLTFLELWRFWPVALIIVGVSLMFRKKNTTPCFTPPLITQSDEAIDEVAIFGGRAIKVESQNFKGGKVTCIFGGSEVQMTRSRLSEQGAVIDMTAIFGGVKIIVPRDWVIKVEVVSIFGGFTDKRLYSPGDVNSSQTLYIKGVTIFGGGELIGY